jgi:hypothetical protein
LAHQRSQKVQEDFPLPLLPPHFQGALLPYHFIQPCHLLQQLLPADRTDSLY